MVACEPPAGWEDASAPSPVQFSSDLNVELVQAVGDDSVVVHAARVSTIGASELSDLFPSGSFNAEDAKLIQFLMKNRHGSPFEHNLFTFRVHAPIFVFRELMRHRIASYNEESGRYKQLDALFYIPKPDRPLQQVGKAGAYEFVSGTEMQRNRTKWTLQVASRVAYERYQHLLAAGVAKEVARMCLPVNIYSSAYVTMNARGLMNFLSLRTKDPNSTFPSFPQYEIEQVARQMEAIWAEYMPLTHGAWNHYGRVCP